MQMLEGMGDSLQVFNETKPVLKLIPRIDKSEKKN
jgi:hypothetical protein